MEDHRATADEVRRFTWNPPPNTNGTLDQLLVARPSQQRSNRPPSVAGAGALDTLPPELLEPILSQLDLRSLTECRLVNRRVAELVENLPSHKIITTHGRYAFRGAFAIKVADLITCDRLCEVVCTAECDKCGDFAGFIYLFTCRRVCLICRSQYPDYLPLRPRMASRKFGLSLRAINTLPRMEIFPGTYSPSRSYIDASVTTLVDHNAGLEAGIQRHGSLKAMTEYTEGQWGSDNSYEDENEDLGYDTYDKDWSDPHRYAALVEVPCFRRVSNEVDHGFHCLGCKDLPSHKPQKRFKRAGLRDARRKFSAVSFGQHLRECGPIKDGKHVSSEQCSK